MQNDDKHFTKLTCTASEFGELGAELLVRGNLVWFTARGTSMHPLVRDGDTLLIAPYRPGGVKVGDIVLCTTETGQVLVHRVLRNRADENGKRHLVQGDHAPKPDGWIPQQKIHGRLVEIDRCDRRLAMTGPKARLLGLLMVLAHRLGLRQSLLASVVFNLLKRSMGFADYLK